MKREEFLGIIRYASDLKSSLVDKYYELKWGDDDDYYSQGDDYYDDEDAYYRWRDGGRDDYAFGAEQEGTQLDFRTLRRYTEEFRSWL